MKKEKVIEFEIRNAAHYDNQHNEIVILEPDKMAKSLRLCMTISRAITTHLKDSLPDNMKINDFVLIPIDSPEDDTSSVKVTIEVFQPDSPQIPLIETDINEITNELQDNLKEASKLISKACEVNPFAPEMVAISNAQPTDSNALYCNNNKVIKLATALRKISSNDTNTVQIKNNNNDIINLPLNTSRLTHVKNSEHQEITLTISVNYVDTDKQNCQIQILDNITSSRKSFYIMNHSYKDREMLIMAELKYQTLTCKVQTSSVYKAGQKYDGCFELLEIMSINESLLSQSTD